MTSQPMWEQIKSARISRSGLIGLGVGLGLGLILGLLVGWVWWPVEWQGSGVGDMAQTAQMDYVATVAEAYAGSGTPAAAERAAARLAQLGPVTVDSFVAAMEYFAAQPGSSEQVRNLATLSIALGLPVDVAANPVLAAAIQPPATDSLTGASSANEAAAPADAPPAQAENQENGINSWAVILLFALLLGAGGAYIIYLANKKRNAEPSDALSPAAIDEAGGAFAEEADYPSSSAGVSGFERSDLRAASPAAPPPPAANASAGSYAASGGYSSRGYSTVYATPPVSGPPGFDPEDEAGAPAKTSSAYYARPADEPELDEMPGAAPLTEMDEEDAEASAFAPAEVAKVAPPLRPVTPSRFARYKTIDTHSAVFHAGMANVDFMRNIEEEGTGRYIGEFGMFVHERNGLLNGNLEEVIAFEVTLVDKADEQPALTTLERTVLSEYAHDKYYDKYASEGQSGGAPITAQKGAAFPLEGSQLLLECTVADVTYSKEGVFRSLTLDMVLKRKE